MSKKMTIVALGLVVLALTIYLTPIELANHANYQTNEGVTFGTIYRIQYQSDDNLHEEIKTALKDVDNALSMFNKQSTISKVNRNEEVVTDSLFELVIGAATQVSVMSGGAFDITVAPLVNAWGFGFVNRQMMDSNKVNSLLPLVNYRAISLENHHLYKENPNIMLDASAIAKGLGCDVVANTLKQHGVKNLLVEIGGEVVAEGVNKEGKPWAIGITKPIDDPTGNLQELQTIVHSKHIAMASSGNYRNFYYENGKRRSHTIDPRTGYPVEHNLLSATVVAENCMVADALATACMAMGVSGAMPMMNRLKVGGYLIIDVGDSLQVLTSENWPWNEEK